MVNASTTLQMFCWGKEGSQLHAMAQAWWAKGPRFKGSQVEGEAKHCSLRTLVSRGHVGSAGL